VPAARSLAPIVAVALALSVSPVPATAQDGKPYALHYDLKQDLIISGIGGALWLGSESLKEHLAPQDCRWCDPNDLDADVRNAVVWSDARNARRASDLLALGVLPAAIATHQLLASRAEGGTTEDGLIDLLIVAEATVLAMDLNQLVKYSVGRQRPYAHYGNWSAGAEPGDPDDNLSFFSGHATVAFSMAAAAGTVSSLRGYKSAPWVWAGGMAAAAAVSYFRMAADKHYLTDVLTGAAIGTATGIAIPRLLHGREASSDGERHAQVTVVPVPIGLRVVW
jgi:membrane-associated phospholipid phosphatase